MIHVLVTCDTCNINIFIYIYYTMCVCSALSRHWKCTTDCWKKQGPLGANPPERWGDPPAKKIWTQCCNQTCDVPFFPKKIYVNPLSIAPGTGSLSMQFAAVKKMRRSSSSWRSLAFAWHTWACGLSTGRKLHLCLLSLLSIGSCILSASSSRCSEYHHLTDLNSDLFAKSSAVAPFESCSAFQP
jgi:hypothetical protein